MNAPITEQELQDYNRRQYNAEKERQKQNYQSFRNSMLNTNPDDYSNPLDKIGAWGTNLLNKITGGGFTDYVMGTTGLGGNEKDWLKERGFDDNSDAMAGSFNLNNYQDALRQQNINQLADFNSAKNMYAGWGKAPGILGTIGGFAGSILDAPTQAVGAVRDLGRLGLSGGQDNAWNTGNKAIDRSISSDIGAGLETAGTIAGFAPGFSGVGSKMIQGGWKAAMPAILGQAASGAAQSIGSSMRNNEDINAGDVLASMAFSTAPDVVGGVLGKGVANRAASKFGADAATALARGNKISNAAQLLGNAGFAAASIIPAVQEANAQQQQLDELAASNGLTTDQLMYLLQYQGY